MRRREMLGTLGGLGAITVGIPFAITGLPSNNAPYTSTLRDPTEVGLEEVSSGFTQPLDLSVSERDTWYVADSIGRIYVGEEDTAQDTVFLDISDSVDAKKFETGLVGLTLHPRFVDTGRFYVRYSSPPRDGTPDGYSHTFVLSEFTAPDLRNADPETERTLLEIPEPTSQHNAGSITFGPDDYLYVGVGDGGRHVRKQDLSAKWWGGNGQDTTNLLGSILRLDVDGADTGDQYSIPDDNPLTGEDGRDEIYAWGFRNPFRMSFSEGRLFVGDVGLARYEEVDIVEKGGNYGWSTRQAKACLHRDQTEPKFSENVKRDPTKFFAPMYMSQQLDHLLPGAQEFCPESSNGGVPFADPVIVYPHRRDGEIFGSSVIGGYVSQNAELPGLEDKYVFGDFSGRLFASPRQQGDGLWPIEPLRIANTDSLHVEDQILSLGRDNSQNIYVLTTGFSEESGKIHRIVSAEGSGV